MEIALAVAPVDRDRKETAELAAGLLVAGLLADQAPLADPQPRAEDEVTADHDLREAPAFRPLQAAKASPNQKDVLALLEHADAPMTLLQQKVAEIPVQVVEHRIGVDREGAAPVEAEQVEVALVLEQLLAPKTADQAASQVIAVAPTLAVEASPIPNSVAKLEAPVPVEIFEAVHGEAHRGEADHLAVVHPVVVLMAAVERAVRVQQIGTVAAPRTQNVDLAPSDRLSTKRFFLTCKATFAGLR